ncbi:MAG: pro-sigmaK processing inhibitor BofA family protein [Bacillota bacterium]|jgi:inhibitor of the pro-sigma K processing machinery
MDLNVVLGAGVALIVIYYLLKALSRPLAGLGKVALRSAVAFAVIWAVNVIGHYFGFHMGLNLLSALTVGVFGIPGAALLLAVKYLI